MLCKDLKHRKIYSSVIEKNCPPTWDLVKHSQPLMSTHFEQTQQWLNMPKNKSQHSITSKDPHLVTVRNSDQAPEHLQLQHLPDPGKDHQEDNSRLTDVREAVLQVLPLIKAVVGPSRNGLPNHRGDHLMTDKHSPDTDHQVVTSPGLPVVHPAEDLPSPVGADLPATPPSTEI